MLRLPDDLAQQFSALLERKGFSGQNKAICLKWLRFYWDFCDKYRHDPCRVESRQPFLDKLQQKRQSEQQRKQAGYAIKLFCRLQSEPGIFARAAPAVSPIQPAKVMITLAAGGVQKRRITYADNKPPQ